MFHRTLARSQLAISLKIVSPLALGIQTPSEEVLWDVLRVLSTFSESVWMSRVAQNGYRKLDSCRNPTLFSILRRPSPSGNHLCLGCEGGKQSFFFSVFWHSMEFKSMFELEKKLLISNVVLLSLQTCFFVSFIWLKLPSFHWFS